MSLKDGKKLQCASPEDTEYFFKACKRGEVVEVTQCSFQEGNQFICKDVMGEINSVNIAEMDNYFCVTPQHRKRVIDRCLNQ
jgi:hypothetical protein